MSETYRTFIALPLSEQIHAQLDDVQRDLRRVCPEGCVRWVKPDSIHLTIFFLGDVLVSRIDPIRAALVAVARNISPFPYTVRSLGAFPNLKRPRVIWVGVGDPSGRLAVLHQAVNEAIANVGFTPEDRPFSPHLTLGRVNRRAARNDVRRLGEALADAKRIAIDLGEDQAQEIVLFRSILKSTGAEYTPLATFSLGV